MQAEEEAFLASIYAEPDDDAPRHVYADWLLERNDPRGLFIALQLQTDSPSASRSSEEAESLARYQSVWLGPALPFIARGTASFRRGFLATAWVNLDAADVAKGKHALPIWRTLEAALGDGIRLIIPENRALRSVGLPHAGLGQVLALPYPTYLREIVLHGRPVEDVSLPLTTSAVPDLRRLAIETTATASVLDAVCRRWLLDHPLLEQLEQLDLASRSNGGGADPLALADWMQQFAMHPNLRQIRLSSRGAPRITLRRVDAKLALAIELSRGTDEDALRRQLRAVGDPEEWSLIVSPSAAAEKAHLALHKRLIRDFPSFVHQGSDAS